MEAPELTEEEEEFNEETPEVDESRAPQGPNRARRRHFRTGWSKHARANHYRPPGDEPVIPKLLTPGSQGHERVEPRWDRWHTTKRPRSTVLEERRTKNKLVRAQKRKARR